MAWGSKQEYGEEGISSKFNEAALQMQRLNKLQDRINESNLNPLLMYPEEKSYGFNIIFNSARSEFEEVSSKLTSVELLQAKMCIARIQKFMKENLVYEHKWDYGMNDYKMIFSLENWEALEKLLFNFKIMVRKHLENHNLTSPGEDDSGL